MLRQWPRPVRVGTTFVLVLISRVLFRSATLHDAMSYLGAMFGRTGSGPGKLLLPGLLYTQGSFLIMAIAAMLVGASNYPCNIGLNRRLNGWRLNDPNYVASGWDKSVSDFTTLASFVDGASLTAIFSEWIKGQAVPTGRFQNGLLEVYNLGENSNFYTTDHQFARLCDTVPINSANQQWQWKGEWWGYGASMIYSHTQMPNRTSCVYHDINEDGRGTITMIPASSNHTGAVNVLFMDGAVRFIKNWVSYLTWYAIATPNNRETVSFDAL